jgi:hypothetical protein
MFLFSGIRAEVEPVPGKSGWFQLTGFNIERWTVDVSDTFGDLERGEVEVDHNAKILGIHSRDPEIALRDPRFNHENDPESGGASFGVYVEAGKMWMLLAVNQAEYAIFRFLCPHEAGADEDETYDPIGDYRVAKKLAKPASKVTPVKKKTKAKA